MRGVVSSKSFDPTQTQHTKGVVLLLGSESQPCIHEQSVILDKCRKFKNTIQAESNIVAAAKLTVNWDFAN